MKKLLILLLFAFSANLFSLDCDSCEEWEVCVRNKCEAHVDRCGDDNDCVSEGESCSELHYCVKPCVIDETTCKEWEYCSADYCSVKQKKCNSGINCQDWEYCSETHDCVDPCDKIDCGAHGKCEIEGSSADCVCDSGYVSSNYTCIIDEHTDEDEGCQMNLQKSNNSFLFFMFFIAFIFFLRKFRWKK